MKGVNRKRNHLRDSKSAAGESIIFAPVRCELSDFRLQVVGLFRLHKVCARAGPRRRADMGAISRHLEPARIDLDADAAIFGGMQDFGAADAERIFDAFDRRNVAEAPAAADDDKLRRCPIHKAAGMVLSR